MKKGFLYFLLLVCVFSVLLSFQLKERFFSHHLKLTFLDVGQGDSILLQFPEGKNLLIDGGGGSPRFTAGKMLVPELRSKGILKLDAVMLTHPDSDHILGFTDLAPNMSIGEYWLNPVFNGEQIVPLLWQTEWIFKRQNVPARFFPVQESLNWQGVEMEVFPSRGEGENNQCLVLLVRYGGCRILLTGDIEEEGEREMAKYITAPVHLLKVAHHGSKTSTTKPFLRKTLPKWSVLSTGWGNRYGHPKDFVVQRLRSVGSEILRTDWHGFIEFTIEAEGKVSCQTSRGSCGESRCI